MFIVSPVTSTPIHLSPSLPPPLSLFQMFTVSNNIVLMLLSMFYTILHFLKKNTHLFSRNSGNLQWAAKHTGRCRGRYDTSQRPGWDRNIKVWSFVRWRWSYQRIIGSRLYSGGFNQWDDHDQSKDSERSRYRCWYRCRRLCFW